MAAVTYLTKAGGLWLLGRVDPSERVTSALEALPGAILVSLLAPSLAAADPPAWLAAAVVAVVARRTGSVLASLVAGVGAVLLLRGVA
jgi:uncharacterized membrane protein